MKYLSAVFPDAVTIFIYSSSSRVCKENLCFLSYFRGFHHGYPWKNRRNRGRGIYLMFYSKIFPHLSLRRALFRSIADGANTEEQGNSPPSWIVESTTGQVTKGTDHTKRRRGCYRRGLVLWSIAYGEYEVELPDSSQYFDRKWSLTIFEQTDVTTSHLCLSDFFPTLYFPIF